MGAGQTSEIRWRQARIPTGMIHVCVGGYNVYAIDTMGKIYKLDQSTILEEKWQEMPGNALYIEGTEGKQLWMVTKNFEVFHYYYGWTGSRWEKVDGQMKQISVGKGQFVCSRRYSNGLGMGG